MVEPLRHRQTKEAATDMFCLKPPRHISTLHIVSIRTLALNGRYRRHGGHWQSVQRRIQNFTPDVLLARVIGSCLCISSTGPKEP